MKKPLPEPVLNSNHFSGCCMEKADVLKYFNISAATLENWVRTAIPNAISGSKYDIKVIENYIKNSNKLSSRANKKKNNSIDTPKELLNYLEGPKEWVKDFIQYAQLKERAAVAKEILGLYKSRLSGVNNDVELASIIPANDLYAYSVAYQILLSAGDKSKTGAYYTPLFIVRSMIKGLSCKDKTFIEPCCGAGFFVIEYIKNYYEEYKTWPNGLIYFNDIDAVGVELTELNIKALTNNELNCFYSSVGDGLSLNVSNIDIVLTNPPYGIKNVYKQLKTTEIFSQFLHKITEHYLCKGGFMDVVLPSSFLAVEKHREIRKFLIDNKEIKKIKAYGKAFDAVFSDIVVVSAVNGVPSKLHKIEYKEGLDRKEISQEGLKEGGYILSAIEPAFAERLLKLKSLPHISLQGAAFGLGIVTGNNKFFLENKKTNENILIVSGKEVLPGKVDIEKCGFVKNLPDQFQQKPPMELFNKKKIIYKFISSKIVSAVDSSGLLTLNSANFFINTTAVPDEYISALLNSSAINDIYRQKFGAPIKVLKGNLQNLPLPLFEKKIQKKIVANYKKDKHIENDVLIAKELDLLLGRVAAQS